MPKAASNSWKGSGKGGGGGGGSSGGGGGGGGGGGWNKKWAVKSGERESTNTNGGTASEEVAVILSPKSADGPYYSKMALLQCYIILKKLETEEKTVEAAPEPEAEQGDAFAPKVSLTEREANDEDGEDGAKTPSRKARAGVKKADKLPKRTGTAGSIEDPGESSPKSPQSPSKRISLSKELPVGSMSLESANAKPFYPSAQIAAAQSQMAAQTAMSPEMAWLFQSMYNPAAAYSAHYTTVMLRNIPNRYTRDMLIDRLNNNYKNAFDFVYLPIDFNSKCNVGYAFINFRLPADAQRFIQEFHNHKTKSVLPGFSSSKVCEVTFARVQGRDANMENLRDEKFIEKLSERKEWQPLFLDARGKEIPFAKTLGVAARKKGRPAGTPAPAAMPQAPAMAMPAMSMPYPYAAYGMPGYPYPGAMSPQMTAAYAAAMARGYRGF